MYSTMIVEDEHNLLKFLNNKLTASGKFEVKLTCSTAQEAIAAFDKEQIDIAFLDIEMPRMTGLELAEKLYEKHEGLQVIFTTAHEHYAVKAFQVEAIDYLLKPISDADIERVIRRLEKKMPVVKEEQQERDVPDVDALPVSCFGRLEARDMEQQLVRWPTRKAEELFAYFLIHQDRLVSKWELLDALWKDMDEKRGLDHLYSTIYRMKQVMKQLPMSPVIQKMNDGYVLECQGHLSDAGMLLALPKLEDDFTPSSLIETLFYSYARPLFGNKIYDWSLPVQISTDNVFTSLCERLLAYYRQLDKFEEADKAIRHYVHQLVENEAMMLRWLAILEDWPGHENEASLYWDWFNEKLAEADLPELHDT